MPNKTCINCGKSLSDEWKICPFCSTPTGPETPEAAVGLIITKIIGGILQQSFSNEASEARKSGEEEQAEANDMARRITHDIEGIIAGTILAYDQKQAEERKRKPLKDDDH